MRVIIRFSLNRDKGSKLRNQLKPILEAHGIKWTGARTGTYEGKNIPESDIQNAMRQFWIRVQKIGAAHLDHFWMYADKDRKLKP